MTTIGPRDPATETPESYLTRVVSTAPRPTPETLDRLVVLLRSGRLVPAASSGCAGGDTDG